MIDNKNEIKQVLFLHKEQILQALSKSLESVHLLNKLKAIRLFKVLCRNDYFSIDEIKGILSFIRLEYRKQCSNMDFMRDTLLEILEISNKHPYEVHECFAADIERQYSDFKEMRTDTSTAEDLYNATTSLGLNVEMFFAELETFWRTKEWLGDILYLCATDFFTNLYIDNEWLHLWTKEYLDTAWRIVDDTKLGQTETDEIVENMMEIVFTEARRIFEVSKEPVFLSKEYAAPFYHLLKQSCKTLSYNKAEILLTQIIQVFSAFAPEFEARVKCYDKICNAKSYYWMNMSLFKILKYLLKYKEISIWDSETFLQVFGFLSMLSLNSINTPALNNLKKEANKTLCMLANKWTQSIPELDEMVNNLISESLELIKSQKDELTCIEDSKIGQTFSIVKGLAIKGSPKSYQTIQKIIEALSETSDCLREVVTRYWFILFSSHDFTKKNKFNISPFYKQRLFSIAFPAIMKSYRETHEGLKNGNDNGVPLGLVSKLIIPICSESSFDLYKDYMDELLPLIVYSLNLKDEEIKNICLKMIIKLLEQEKDSNINIEELTMNLTKSLSDKLSMHTKNLVITWLNLVLQKADNKILEYRNLVIAKLKKFLNDRKRSTRRLAVKCLNDWSIA
jgi:hypothetical protein